MSAWSLPIRLSELAREPAVRRLEPDEATRARIARDIGVAGLPAFSAEARLRPWHDGVELEGRWKAVATYACGVTVELFDEALEGEFVIRAVPPSSPLAAPPEREEGEIELDLDSDDPPDVLEGESIDVAAYLVEHLALELDPFPRKPGAVFEPPPAEGPESPFAVLKRLKD
jgi:hypothetical protein